MEATAFNPAQMQLLVMMSFVKSDKALESLKQAISNHFAKQAQEEIHPMYTIVSADMLSAVTILSGFSIRL